MSASTGGELVLVENVVPVGDVVEVVTGLKLAALLLSDMGNTVDPLSRVKSPKSSMRSV